MQDLFLQVSIFRKTLQDIFCKSPFKPFILKNFSM